MKTKEELIKYIYSKEYEDMCYEWFEKGNTKRYFIYEWKNFIDYDVIPLIRKFIEEQFDEVKK